MYANLVGKLLNEKLKNMKLVKYTFRRWIRQFSIPWHCLNVKKNLCNLKVNISSLLWVTTSSVKLSFYDNEKKQDVVITLYEECDWDKWMCWTSVTVWSWNHKYIKTYEWNVKQCFKILTFQNLIGNYLTHC